MSWRLLYFTICLTFSLSCVGVEATEHKKNVPIKKEVLTNNSGKRHKKSSKISRSKKLNQLKGSKKISKNPVKTKKHQKIARKSKKLKHQALVKSPPQVEKTKNNPPKEPEPEGLLAALDKSTRKGIAHAGREGAKDPTFMLTGNLERESEELKLRTVSDLNQVKQPIKLENKITKNAGHPGENAELPTAQKDESEVSVVSEKVSVTGALDEAVVNPVIQKHFAEIRYCYERTLQESPNVAGKIAIQFKVSRQGDVTETTIKKASGDTRPVGACISDVIKRIKFPPTDPTSKAEQSIAQADFELQN